MPYPQKHLTRRANHRHIFIIAQFAGPSPIGHPCGDRIASRSEPPWIWPTEPVYA
jgi:hypothetical protein